MTLSPSLVVLRVGCLLTLACLYVYGGCRETAGCGVTGGTQEGDAAVLELLPCGSEGAGLRPCWGELKGLWGLDVALRFTLILSAPPTCFPCEVLLSVIQGGRGKEDPNRGCHGKVSPSSRDADPWLPMGLARLFKKVIGIKGARAAAASWRGRD